eukprot:TRINITY_DN12356_c0_g3_i1.p1 TRINITY_DN12356_c0_g3~~TRINITY_DN12356_c0_g3_i1.p1  ORF type:complete len:128 (+),score=10.05 TRINITY_DN12356_c0_g3_i1:44-427(+)
MSFAALRASTSMDEIMSYNDILNLHDGCQRTHGSNYKLVRAVANEAGFMLLSPDHRPTNSTAGVVVKQSGEGGACAAKLLKPCQIGVDDGCRAVAECTSTLRNQCLTCRCARQQKIWRSKVNFVKHS